MGRRFFGGGGDASVTVGGFGPLGSRPAFGLPRDAMTLQEVEQNLALAEVVVNFSPQWAQLPSSSMFTVYDTIVNKSRVYDTIVYGSFLHAVVNHQK